MTTWLRRGSVSFLGFAVSGALACATSGDGGGTSGTGSSGVLATSGAGTGVSLVMSGSNSGSPVLNNDSDATTGGGDGSACQNFDVSFVPKVPLVDVLADRSGSIFATTTLADGGMGNEWVPLRAATLSVIQSLQSTVAFGFAAYTGVNPSNANPDAGLTCPILDRAPIALNNYPAIDTVYMALGQPMFKAETPAALSLDAVAADLKMAATTVNFGTAQAGGKTILFVTDSETDFCDDGSAICPADAVIAEIQKLSAQGIQTLILGVGSSLSPISVSVLQDFANAGAGLPTVAPPLNAGGPSAAAADIYNQCNGRSGWSALSAAAGHTNGQALATYASAVTSNATVFSPSATDVADLTNQIATALKTVKSCSFDLQDKIQVDLANASEGHVTIDGTSIPFDATNGWTMSSSTQLDLVGSACQSWRSTGVNIHFAFPCEILIQPPR